MKTATIYLFIRAKKISHSISINEITGHAQAVLHIDHKNTTFTFPLFNFSRS